ncbi:MAG: Gfo/Idh/MocA family oxidoreductase, partial [Anaerolineae bacterium]
AGLSGMDEFLGARTVIGLDAVWGSDDVDVVYAALPAGAREELVQSALAAGKHVLMAPPLALDVATASRLLDTASGHDVALGLTTASAVDPALGAVRMQILAGLYGAPVFWQSARMGAGPGVDWQAVAADELGLFHHLTGLAALEVSAQRAGGASGAEVVLLTVAYRDQAIGSYAVGTGVVGSGEQTEQRRLITASGQIDLIGEPRAVRDRSVEDAPAGVWRPVRYAGERGGLEQVVARFVHGVQRGDLATISGGDPLEVPRILEAARTSLAEGRAVALTR